MSGLVPLFAVGDSYVFYVSFVRRIDKWTDETKISSRKLYLYRKFTVCYSLLLLLLLLLRVFNLSVGRPELFARFSTVKTIDNFSFTRPRDFAVYAIINNIFGFLLPILPSASPLRWSTWINYYHTRRKTIEWRLWFFIIRPSRLVRAFQMLLDFSLTSLYFLVSSAMLFAVNRCIFNFIRFFILCISFLNRIHFYRGQAQVERRVKWISMSTDV